MNVEIGTEAAQFLEKEYINGIFVAVYNIICIGHSCIRTGILYIFLLKPKGEGKGQLSLENG
jgi:hypothetical protein